MKRAPTSCSTERSRDSSFGSTDNTRETLRRFAPPPFCGREAYDRFSLVGGTHPLARKSVPYGANLWICGRRPSSGASRHLPPRGKAMRQALPKPSPRGGRHAGRRVVAPCIRESKASRRRCRRLRRPGLPFAKGSWLRSRLRVSISFTEN